MLRAVSHGDPLFIFRLTPLVLALAELDAAATDALLAECGLPASATRGAITAPLSRVERLVEEAARRSSKRPFGVALARAVPFGTYELAELLVRTAPDLERGLRELERHASLINPVGRFEVRETADETELHYFVHGTADALGATMNEFTFAYLHRALDDVTPGGLPLSRVWFSHRASEDAPALRACFGVDVTYGARTCGLSIPRGSSPTPLRTADPVVFAFLAKQGQERLRALGDRSAAAVVVDVIESQLGFAAADLDAVSARLGQTPRTVQRRLGDEGTTFREVLEDARKRRAEAMLADGMPFATIAEALGFSGVRSFRRAHRRWTR